jgi:acetolactate synthase small subunit
MVTFVVHVRRTPETLARVVSLFHRRRVEIERLTADRADDPKVLCITITVDMDADQAQRIETNLYELVDVTLVEKGERGTNVGVPPA